MHDSPPPLNDSVDWPTVGVVDTCDNVACDTNVQSRVDGLKITAILNVFLSHLDVDSRSKVVLMDPFVCQPYQHCGRCSSK